VQPAQALLSPPACGVTMRRQIGNLENALLFSHFHAWLSFQTVGGNDPTMETWHVSRVEQVPGPSETRQQHRPMAIIAMCIGIRRRG
jgi:hypothetical protein